MKKCYNYPQFRERLSNIQPAGWIWPVNCSIWQSIATTLVSMVCCKTQDPRAPVDMAIRDRPPDPWCWAQLQTQFILLTAPNPSCHLIVDTTHTAACPWTYAAAQRWTWPLQLPTPEPTLPHKCGRNIYCCLSWSYTTIWTWTWPVLSLECGPIRKIWPLDSCCWPHWSSPGGNSMVRIQPRVSLTTPVYSIRLSQMLHIHHRLLFSISRKN